MLSTLTISKGALLYHSSKSTINELIEKPTYFTVDGSSWVSKELYSIITSKNLTIGICCEPSDGVCTPATKFKSIIISNNPETKMKKKGENGLNEFDEYVIRICRDNEWDGILHSIDDDGAFLEVILINPSVHVLHKVVNPLKIMPSLDLIAINRPDPNHLDHIKNWLSERDNYQFSHRMWYHNILARYI